MNDAGQIPSCSSHPSRDASMWVKVLSYTWRTEVPHSPSHLQLHTSKPLSKPFIYLWHSMLWATLSFLKCSPRLALPVSFSSSFLRICLLVLVSTMISFSATLFVIFVGEHINVICFEHSKDVKMCTVKFFFLTPLSQSQDSFPERQSMLPLFHVFLHRHNRYKQAYIYRFCLSTHIYIFSHKIGILYQ